MSGKSKLKESFVKVRGFVFGFVLSVVLVAGAVFAAGGAQNIQNKWNAFWHGTDWIDAGKIIRAKEIAENFEWLKQQVDDLQSQINNGSGGSGGIGGMTVYSTPGTHTFTVPQGVSKIKVTLVGGGGGGGSFDGNNGQDGGNTTLGSITAYGGKGGGKAGEQPGYGGSAQGALINMHGERGKHSSRFNKVYEINDVSRGGDGGNSGGLFGHGGLGGPETNNQNRSNGYQGNGYGSGGGGGGCYSYGSKDPCKGGNGGGGGGAAVSLITVSPGQNIKCTVGQGGSGGVRGSWGNGGKGADGICIIEW